MNDCPNADIRDRLPDWGRGALPPDERALVAAHLEGCVDCRDEVALLATVRRARPIVAAPDVARIVAALPPAPRPQVVPIRPRSAPAWRSWRAAAAAAIVIAGGSALAVRQGGEGNAIEPGLVAAARPGTQTPSAPTPAVPTPSALGLPAAATGTPLLAMLDETGDLTPDEYDALATQLENESQLFTPVVDLAADPLAGGAQ